MVTKTTLLPYQQEAYDKLHIYRIGALYMEMGTGKTRTALELIKHRVEQVMLQNKDIYDREDGKLPVSVIDKPIGERMASTIRHNRARGSHDVDLMSTIVAELHKIGKSDAWLAKHLGMDRDEILRLKQITGLSELFKDKEFSRSWIPGEETDGNKGETGL